MFKFFVIAALIACCSAKPGILAPFSLPVGGVPLATAPVPVVTAPLSAAGGSSQVDVRNNYDGTLSSYTTAPFEYAGPVSSRYVSGVPAAPALVSARYAAAPLTAAAYSAPLTAAGYAAPLTAAAAYSTPYASQLAAAYSAYPYASPYATPYASYASPYLASGAYAAPYAAPQVVV
ncbi:cuticle protein 16.5 [Drosophila madeirensis]|uniref:Cuticle protein 16.5 n=1 Tax=Drosophila madeirensis TaxID=30013 RepID=A0AAU9FW87_DROMD